MNEIRFWRYHKDDGSVDPYFCFSNFARYPFIVNNTEYRTSEHYYQSHKFLDYDLQQKVINEKTPKDCAEIGRDENLPLRKDWEIIKVRVMKEALFYKFESYRYLQIRLVNTKDSIIIEDSPIDYFWGCGKDGSGLNMLGKCLMDLRDYYNGGNITAYWMNV